MMNRVSLAYCAGLGITGTFMWALGHYGPSALAACYGTGFAMALAAGFGGVRAAILEASEEIADSRGGR